MAEDDAKGRAARKPRTAKKPQAEATPARTAKARSKAGTKSETEAETVAAPNVEAAKPPPSDIGPRRPLRLPPTKGLIVGLAAVAVLAVLVLAWPGARDRLAGMFSRPEPSAPVAALKPAVPKPPVPKPTADSAPELAAVAAQWGKLTDRLAALEGSLTRLSGDIATLKSAPPAVGMSALEGRLAGIEKRLAALTESLKALEDRRARPPVASDAAGSLALLALAGALRRGTPHGALAARARAGIAKSDADGGFAAKLNALVAYEASGVPSKAALAARLKALAPPVAAPPPTKATPADGGLWERVTRRLKELVVIRRVGEDPAAAPAAGDQARLAASRAMAAGDVAGALAALDNVRGPDIATWRRDARARLKADALADDLDMMIGRRLGRGATAP